MIFADRGWSTPNRYVVAAKKIELPFQNERDAPILGNIGNWFTR